MKPSLALLACFAFSGTAFAQTSPEPTPTGDVAGAAAQPTAAKDVRREVPVVAYTYSAAGVSAKTYGVQAYGLGLAASGQDAVLGGGGAIWGSPIDRLTIVVDGQRNL